MPPLHVVVPTHLVVEMNETVMQYSRVLHFQAAVITDAELKSAFLFKRNNSLPVLENSRVVFGPQSVFLYDEIDDMYDATKSTLNIITRQHKLDVGLVCAAFRLGLKLAQGGGVGRDGFEVQFSRVFKNGGFKRNIHFGMSHVPDTTHRFAIPYEKRVDSPIEGSRFASVVFTLALTFRYFWVGVSAADGENVFRLEAADIRKIVAAQNMRLLHMIAAHWGGASGRQSDARVGARIVSRSSPTKCRQRPGGAYGTVLCAGYDGRGRSGRRV